MLFRLSVFPIAVVTAFVVACNNGSDQPGPLNPTPVVTRPAPPIAAAPTASPSHTPTSVPTSTPAPIPTNTPSPVPIHTPTSIPTPTPVTTLTSTPVPTSPPTLTPTPAQVVPPTSVSTSTPTETSTPAQTPTPLKPPVARTKEPPVAVPPRTVSIDLPAGQSGVLTHESGARVEVPLGAATSAVTVAISEVDPPPSPFKVGRVFEFSLQEASLLKPVVLHFPFEIEPGTDSPEIVALRWDGEKDVWLELDRDVDLSTRMVAVTVSELGLFSTGVAGGDTFGEDPYSSDQGGSLIWEYKTKSSRVTSIVESGGVLYVAGCSGDGSLYALDAGTGSVLWQHSTRGETDSCESASPVVTDGVVYIVSNCRDCNRGLFGGVLVNLGRYRVGRRYRQRFVATRERSP